VTATYLFNSDGLEVLARYVAPDTLFAFDLDGTLAPIVEDYTAVRVTSPIRATLTRLVNLAKVAVITGRSRKDAEKILGFEPHLLIGNHGAEWPFDLSWQNSYLAETCLKWSEGLHVMLDDVQGVEIEFKGASLSLHYRKAVNQEYALAQIDTAIGKLCPMPRTIAGKLVVNVLPMEVATKGVALVAAMKELKLHRAIFIGDDVTDEEVFQLKNIDVFGIHVGKDNNTAAKYYLKKQSALLGLINSMVGILESYSVYKSAIK